MWEENAEVFPTMAATVLFFLSVIKHCLRTPERHTKELFEVYWSLWKIIQMPNLEQTFDNRLGSLHSLILYFYPGWGPYPSSQWGKKNARTFWQCFQ
jgi:hypothetical protein